MPMSRTLCTRIPKIRFFKLEYFIITVISITITSVYCYYFYRCRIVSIPIDYAFEETEDDILTDAAYARALVIPSKPEKEQDEKYQNQKLQYQKQATEMTKLISEATAVLRIQEVYIPQVHCQKMARMGTLDKCGYFLCNPWVLAKSDEECIVYSLGVSGAVGFEEDIYNATNQKCKILCFDDHDESENIFSPFRGTFMRAVISHRTEPGTNRYSLLDIMKKYGHRKIDILKIDIEGGEFNVLPTFLRQFNGTVCQIAMEMHSGGYREDSKLWVKMFQMLERRGYRLYYREPNYFNPCCHVYSYIHLTCFERFGLDPHSVLFTYFV